MRRPTCRPRSRLRTTWPGPPDRAAAATPHRAPAGRYLGRIPRLGGAMPELTHEVFNQPEPLVDTNLFETNRPLRDALRLNAPQLDTAALQALGALAGSGEMQAHARLANVHTPELRTHDRFGRRIDEVEFHPSYHALMAAAVGAGLHGTPWAGGPSAHVLR